MMVRSRSPIEANRQRNWKRLPRICATAPSTQRCKAGYKRMNRLQEFSH
jgi:hypothetical protein